MLREMLRRSRTRIVLAGLAAWALLVVACGRDVVVAGDHSEREASSPTDAGYDAAPDSGASAVEAGHMLCGGNTCGVVDLGNGLGFAQPCCYNDKCGVVFSNVCIEVDSPGVVNPECPSAGIYSGCCRPDGVCGLVATGTPLGCVNPFAFFPTIVLGKCVYPAM
jgi:hypothetical protein